MKDSILVKTLTLFSSEELELLSTFVRSKYFNTGSHYNSNIALFDLLKEVIQEGLESNLEKNWVNQNLYGSHGKDESETRYLDNRMSELMTINKKFITWQQIHKKWGKPLEDLALAKFYQERGLIEDSERITKKIKPGKNNLTLEDKLLLTFWKEESKFESSTVKNQRKGDLNIPNTVQALILFFATKLLKLALSQVQQSRVVLAYEPKWKVFVEQIRQLIQAQSYFQDLNLMLLEGALALMEDQHQNPQEQLSEFIHLLEINEKEIDPAILNNIAAIARIYCTWKINQGHRELRQMRIDLYKNHLENGLLFENGKIIPSTYINMINIGLWSNEKEWVQLLLTKYKNKIDGDEKMKVLHYAYTLFHMHLKQFTDARTHLNKLLQLKKFKDMNLERLSRVLEVKLLYEEEELDFILNQLHNLLMFVRRGGHIFNSISREMHTRFIQILKRIIHLKEQSNLAQLDQSQQMTLNEIKLELTNPPAPIVERLWLLAKVEELEQNGH